MTEFHYQIMEEKSRKKRQIKTKLERIKKLIKMEIKEIQEKKYNAVCFFYIRTFICLLNLNDYNIIITSLSKTNIFQSFKQIITKCSLTMTIF